jgi:mono/diheme cytochrome c family protein
MATLGLILLFVVLGVGVIFVAFSGGLGAARQAYLTRGGTAFRIIMPLIYIGFGIAIPAVVIAGATAKEGASGALAAKVPSASVARGKHLFESTCSSCHTLKASNARGVTGPNLDQIGQVTPQRVLNAIKIGGTGQLRMPANLLQGQSAQDVANYVSQVAGH